MLCTPGYTSPEQALGRPVDRRSDVYSMAITLYRVLVGRLPFHEVHGRHVAAMLARHIYNEPTQLADAAPTGNIPPGVAAVVESALRKDPAERPQTMLEFSRRRYAPRLRTPPRVRRLAVALDGTCCCSPRAWASSSSCLAFSFECHGNAPPR